MTAGFSGEYPIVSAGSFTDTSASQQAYSPPLAQRLVAAVAHLLLLGSLPGIVLTCVIWLAWRKVPFVARHARRALVADLLAHLVLISVVAILLVVALTFTGTTLAGHAAPGGFSLLAVLGALGGLTLLPLAALLGFVLLALRGAARALRGQPLAWCSNRRDGMCS